MKFTFSFIIFSFLTLNIYPQVKNNLALRNINDFLIGSTSLDSLPKVLAENAVDLQTFTGMVKDKLPGIIICNSEQCNTQLLLVYDVYHDKHNIIYGSVIVECKRQATINETGYSGFFTIWRGIREFLLSETNTRDIKNVILGYVEKILEDFLADYKTENKD